MTIRIRHDGRAGKISNPSSIQFGAAAPGIKSQQPPGSPWWWTFSAWRVTERLNAPSADPIRRLCLHHCKAADQPTSAAGNTQSPGSDQVCGDAIARFRRALLESQGQFLRRQGTFFQRRLPERSFRFFAGERWFSQLRRLLHAAPLLSGSDQRPEALAGLDQAVWRSFGLVFPGSRTRASCTAAPRPVCI